MLNRFEKPGGRSRAADGLFRAGAEVIEGVPDVALHGNVIRTAPRIAGEDERLNTPALLHPGNVPLIAETIVEPAGSTRLYLDGGRDANPCGIRHIPAD